MKEKHKSQADKPLDQSKLIEEYLSEEEVSDLLHEGFNEEQIATVAKMYKDGEKFDSFLDFITEILPWIIPIK